MNKTNFKRFGDTSFRLKNQVKFYSEILIFICNSINNLDNIDYLTVDEIWNFVNSNIVEYNEKSVDHKTILLKQLIEFELIVRESEKVRITNLGKAFISFLDKNYDYDILSVLFFYIMINVGKLSKIFRGFVLEVIDEEDEVSDDLIRKFIFSSNSYESNKNIESNYINVNEEQVEKILEQTSIQNVFNRRKKLAIDKSLPSLIKNIRYSSDENVFYKIIDNDKKLKENLKKMYHFFNKNKKRKIINDSELKKYVFTRGNNLIYDAINAATYRTINIDYFDINKRWFIGCNLLVCNKNKYYINKYYKKLYIDLLNIKFDSNLENLKLFLSKINIKVNINNLPYNKNEILNMLEMCSEERWGELKSCYELDGISNATIFEYLVNLAFFISRKDKVENFRKYCFTLLEDDLKPKSHAPAGSPDGMYEKHNFYSTIESTIIKNLEGLIKNEYTSIQRHSFKKYDEILKNTNYYMSNIILSNKCPSTIFIVLSDLDKEILNNFCSKEKSSFFANSNIEIKILTLSYKHIINLFKNDKLSEVYKIFNNLPIPKNTKMDDYEEMINKLIM